jgi:uncharacterized SAM-binding protein YcdF (DUF218 family)
MSIETLAHFIEDWFFPPRIFFLGLLFGLGLIYGGYRRKGKRLLAGIVIITWFVSTPLIAQALIDGLQKQFPPLTPPYTLAQENKPAAIVVLGSGVDTSKEYPEKDIPSTLTLSRLNYAVYLYKQTHLPFILSGGNSASTGRTEATIMAETLAENYGVTTTPILEQASHNTQQQGRQLKEVLQKQNIHAIYLVTNVWHMRRSLYTFQKSFAGKDISITPAPMGYIFLKSDSLFINLLPSLKALAASSLALHEYIGMWELHLFSPDV